MCSEDIIIVNHSISLREGWGVKRAWEASEELENFVTRTLTRNTFDFDSPSLNNESVTAN